jgi:hypothetical protein
MAAQGLAIDVAGAGDLLVAGLAMPAPAVGDLLARLAAERETHDHVLALHRPALDPAW